MDKKDIEEAGKQGTVNLIARFFDWIAEKIFGEDKKKECKK